MLTTSCETKKSHVRENSPYILAPKKEKNDSLEGEVRKRAETEGKECWKKKEQEDVGQHTTPPQEDVKQSVKWDFPALT